MKAQHQLDLVCCLDCRTCSDLGFLGYWSPGFHIDFWKHTIDSFVVIVVVVVVPNHTNPEQN